MTMTREPITHRGSEGDWEGHVPVRLDLYIHDDGRSDWEAIWDGEGWVFSDDRNSEERERFQVLFAERYGKSDGRDGLIEISVETSIEGLVETNSRGGKQSKLSTRHDLVPPAALHAVALTLAEGAEKYGERNWRKIDVMSHLNHALTHLNNYRMLLISDVTPYDADSVNAEEELSHAATRLLMALEIELVGEDEDED